MTLTEFLLARLGEDEADLLNSRWDDQEDWSKPGWVTARRLQVDIEAKVRIIEYTEALASCAEHSMVRTEGCPECSLAQQVELYDQQILGRLAIPYADHPDYREEWRP